MSRPWRGGYSNRRPYKNGPRGGGGAHNKNQRYTRWDSDNRFNDNYGDKDDRYNNECNFNRGPPVYMNSENSVFWQGYYNMYQAPPPQYQQQGPPPQNYNNSSNSYYRNYNYPIQVNRQYNNHSNDDRNCSSSNNAQAMQPVETTTTNNVRSCESSESPPTKTTEEPVVAHPGSEAAREKKRAEIAERLKQLDQQKEDKLQEGSKNVEKSSPTKESSVNQRKRNASITKWDQEELKKIRTNEKSTATNNKTRISSVQKDVRPKNKESPPQKKVSPAGKTTSKTASVASTSGQRRREILPNVARAKNTRKSSPVTKRTSSQAAKSSSNQNKATSSTTSVVKNDILSRLSALGKDEIRSLINNPQLPKSQELLKTLMKCYQDSKALELDKRRFMIATPNSTPEHMSTTGNTSDSNFFNIGDIASIAMSDLPFELVNQIQSFLGCDINLLSEPNISQSPLLHTPLADASLLPQLHDSNDQFYATQNQHSANNFDNLPISASNEPNSGENYQNIRDNISESSTEKAPSPYQAQIFDEQDLPFHNSNNFNLPPYFDALSQLDPEDNQTPFMILNELSLIDLRIQADIQRKMQLYKQLHIYLQENHANQNKTTVPISNHVIGPFIPPPPFPNQNDCGVLQNDEELNLIHIPGPSSAPTPNEEVIIEEQPVQTVMRKEPPNVITIDDEDALETIPLSSRQNVRSGGTSKQSRNCICVHLNKAVPEKVIHKLPTKMKINDMKVVNRKTVLLACEDGMIYGYNLETGSESHKFVEHKSSVNVILSSPKRNEQKEIIKGQFTLCSGGSDEILCFFDFESQKCLSSHYLASSITCLEQGAPNILYVGVNCGQVFMCNIETMQLMGNPIDCGSKSILSILATKEGPRKVLFISSVGQPVVLRDAQNGLLLRTFESSGQDKIVGLAEYGNLLLCRVLKKEMPYFNITTGHQEGILTVNSIATDITVFKHVLFVGTCGGQIHVFDLRTKEKLLEFTGPVSTVKCIQIKFNRIVTCGGGKSKKLVSVSFPPEILRNLRGACTCKAK